MESSRPGSLTAIESETTTSKIIQILKDAILTGVFKPGDTLVERQLSAELGVSKTPVREALISLAASGLVYSMPNRRVVVTSLSEQQIYEIYQLRMLLEPWALAETARTQPKKHIAEAADILAKAAELTSAVSGTDEEYAELSKINRRFHQTLYSGCRNSLVIKRLDEVQDLTLLAINNVLWRKWPTWSVELEEHQAILRSIRRGDDAAAQDLARRHIQRTLDNLGLDGRSSSGG